MTGNQTPHRMTWEQQMKHDRKSARKRVSNKRIAQFCGDVIGVIAIATIFICFLLFTA